MNTDDCIICQIVIMKTGSRKQFLLRVSECFYNSGFFEINGVCVTVTVPVNMGTEFSKCQDKKHDFFEYLGMYFDVTNDD